MVYMAADKDFHLHVTGTHQIEIQETESTRHNIPRGGADL